MALASPPISIADLRRTLERLESHDRHAAAVLPFGISCVDGHLPNGGLTLGHVHEVSEGGAASQYAGLATLFTGGIIARIPGPVLWCLRGRDLFAPALARIGLHPDRVIYCETWKDRDVLPAMEEGLRCRGLACVVGELTQLSLTASRRLQLTAGEAGVTAIVLRRWRHAGEKHFAQQPSAAATRWRVTPHPSPDAGFDGLQRQHWKVELLRARGGGPRSWILEVCNATGHLAFPAEVALGQDTTNFAQRAAAG
jgi:protein ImuA